jgi:hypothetical protein
MATVSKKSLYSLHPGYAMEATSMANLIERTGKSLEEWIVFLKKSGPPTEKERREWLKKEHGITTNYASWIAERAEGKGGAENYDPEALVDAMFAGPKESLLPVYEKLLRLGLKIGKDVKACPCATIVPLYRNHVFAQIKPTTQTRIDLGLALGNMKTPKRLINTGGYEKKDRITHRIPITTLSEIDDEVKRWLKNAYDRDE